MIKEKLTLSQDQPVLDQILKAHSLSYKEFAQFIEVDPEALRRYRKGKREFRLNMEQLKRINSLLIPFEISLTDLPNDWILDDAHLVSRKVS